MSSDAKVLRGQLRQIVKDALPEALTEQLYKDLEQKIFLRLKALETQVQSQMKEMSENHKNTMSYLVRSVTVPTKQD